MTHQKRVGILHYASPPVVGGVESTIAHHAKGLVENGYAVRVISGRGSTFDAHIETHIIPLLNSTHPDILALKTHLDAGVVPEAFEHVTEKVTAELQTALHDCDAVIVHNAHSLNKNLPFTAALAKLSEDASKCWIAWCHDLAWTNPQYLPELHERYPYTLLKTVWQNTVYVTVSEARRDEIAQLLNIPVEDVVAVVPGVDPASFFQWTVTTQKLAKQLRWMNADGILLLPARLTRRKNIALGLKVLAELRRQTQKDFRLIITGPPGPHNPNNPGYLGELLTLQKELDLQDAAHFLYQQGEDEDHPLIPDDTVMANLFTLSDALFFPSEQEGFGIPMLEAGIAGIPIFCSDIPPLRGTAGEFATYFDPIHDSPQAIAQTLYETLQHSATAQLKRHVRQNFRWDALITQKIIPLIEG